MPTFQKGELRLYYETLGRLREGRAPVVLVHGSTATGQSDWGGMAHWLARTEYVIVPDCRGHGRSNNPLKTYSFREMAQDTAALVRGLGLERAHVIGHSNGGNVALVMLLEHPEVVQTCVIQAGNAYVSPDLVEREPWLFDPERAAREDPSWVAEMIELHGPAHGDDYWRELLRLTLAETISQPNYTAQDLARAAGPVLVIQGAEDKANAPGRHAQFIAAHIPDAELWLVAGVGHNVHKERPAEWLNRVSDFLRRRGDPANEALDRVQRTYYPDARQVVWNVHAETVRDQVHLTGQVLEEAQHEAAVRGLGATPVSDQVRVLLTPSTPWALVTRNVTDVQREARFLSERVSQARLGDAVRILEEQNGWLRVRLERDGYLGWLREEGVRRTTGAEVEAWQSRVNVLVIAQQARGFAERVSDSDAARPLVQFSLGVKLPAGPVQKGWRQVVLPDARRVWVEAADLTPLEARPRADEGGIRWALDLISRCVGVPYLWGGCTPFGFDCSGLTQTFWGLLGVSLPRDADQQFQVGTVVQGSPEPGDLLFFADSTGDSNRYARVTHVALSLGGDEMIHANGAAGGVSVNSLNPNSPHYRAWLREHLAGVRRYPRG